MKKLLSFVLFVAMFVFAYAQNISVLSFMPAPTDVTANLEGTTVIDQNGEKCALFRVQTTQTGFSFDVGVLGVQKVVQKVGEIWVYVPRGVRRITIRHQQLGTCEYNIPIPVEAAKTYTMNLTTAQVETILHEAVSSQYVLFKLVPSTAIVEFDGQTLETVDGTATVRVPFGTYNYRVQAPRYAPEAGTLTVSDPKNKHVVSLSLQPQFANFTFTAPNQSEIWVNERKMGTGSCTIELTYGTYMVESRLPNHRSVQQEVELAAGGSRTITLKAPIPIYGSLDINSLPADAVIYLDEKRTETTPHFIDKILIGNHKIKIEKNGYKSYETTITVREGETTKTNFALEKGPAEKIVSTAERGGSQNVRTFTVNGVSFDMITVEGGTFTMGATAEQGGDAYDDEKPTHQVTLSSYSIGKTEVTQALWQAVMGTNPSRFKGDNLPVESVSWDDCKEFIRKLNALTGQNFRLPTEAEWEFAARGGKKSKGYKYAGSDYIDEVAWYDNNAGSKTHPVGTKKPNELGLYDMSGNVWEWCQDWYGSYSYSSQTNPSGPTSGSCRVRRGGSCDYFARRCRVSDRDNRYPDIGGNYLGFRLCLL